MAHLVIIVGFWGAASYKKRQIVGAKQYYNYLCINQKNMEKHATKFTLEKNRIGELFNTFPELNVRQVARAMGINETLMQQYVNGAKKPTYERRMEIERYIHELGHRLAQISLE